MNKIILKSFAKINLALDVLGKLPDGYHQVEMIMQQIELHDLVQIEFIENKEAKDIEISVKTNKYFIPTDMRNIAYKAAAKMASEYGHGRKGHIRINIKKDIPVSAGLAGGSSNAAAVILGINALWKLKITLDEMAKIGEPLGADVPFSIFSAAYGNPNLKLKESSHAMCCALATGKGTQLEKLPGLKAYLVISKPPISVSTKEVYGNLDLEKIESRPHIREIIEGLREGNTEKVKRNIGNVLEIYTLKRYDKAMYTKNKMKEAYGDVGILMSGSGPTIYALIEERAEAEQVLLKLKKCNKETYLTRTIV